MKDSKRKALIWGSGKIGRGFIADILNKGGYNLTFVDSDKELTDKLKDRRSYTIINVPGKGEEETITIQDYEVYHTGEREAIRQSLSDCTMAAIVVFPTAFDSVAKEIAEALEARAVSAESGTLNILICANIPHPAKEFKGVLENYLSEKGKAYLNNKVGLIDTLLMRIAIEPTAEMKAKDPLVVLTNGYPQMPVDGTAFKGAMPQIHEIIYTDNIEAQEKRKMYTYNMVHAVFAYIGSQKGHRYVAECTADDEVREIAQNTLEEVSEGLQREFGFTKDEMDAWNRQVMKNMSNELLSDGLIRVGGDPIRKLKREDRLTGPALLCRKNGIMPYYLAKAIAGAFIFTNPDDASCVKIQEYLSKNGIKQAVKKFCGLDREVELISLIAGHYEKAVAGKGIGEDDGQVGIIKKAYELGFKYEKTYKGCAQCVLAAFYELTGKIDAMLFQAASGLSGGIAITGDGSCGGYTGGVMYMGSQVGRRLERTPIDGDKVAQYRSYKMAQELHDKFIETYGSVTCMDIHKEIFGKAYCLRTKEIREEFEAAGAHDDKCTTVVANACSWIAEILLDSGYIQV